MQHMMTASTINCTRIAEFRTPSVRFYFRYEDILQHPGYVFDWYLPVKIKDDLLLADYLYDCVIPIQNHGKFTNIIQLMILDKVHYLSQDSFWLLDWLVKYITSYKS